MKGFVVACAQLPIVPLGIAENTKRALELVARAVKETGARVVVLPETITTGFTPGIPARELWSLCEPMPGPLLERVGRAAAVLGVYLAFPAYERGPEPGVVYNSVALLGPDGTMLGRYRKTHLFPTERLAGGGWSTPGVEPVVVHTPLASIGLTICYDGDFPELYRCEALLGAELVLRPSALLRSYPIWELTNRARAYDNHLYIAAANSVGPDAGGSYYFGHSLIVSPRADLLAIARGGEEIIAAELDPDPIKEVTLGSSAPMIFDHLEDRNLEAYRGQILEEGRSRFEPARRIPTRG
jgi:predicted amidohydrolase